MIKALLTAIYSRLSGDATLGGLATGGAHLGLAPSTASAPYVTYSVYNSVRHYTLGRLSHVEVTLAVKGVARDDTAGAFAGWDRATDIADRAEELLTDQEAALTLSGGRRVGSIRAVGSIDYPEPADGVTFHHVGHRYKILLFPS